MNTTLLRRIAYGILSLSISSLLPACNAASPESRSAAENTPLLPIASKKEKKNSTLKKVGIAALIISAVGGVGTCIFFATRTKVKEKKELDEATKKKWFDELRKKEPNTGKLEQIYTKFKTIINEADSDGSTALILTAKGAFCTPKVLDWLIARKADVQKTDSEGLTFLHHMVKSFDEKLVTWLKEKKRSKPKEEIAKKIIELVNTQDKQKRTPLLSAAESGSWPMTKWLLANDADITKTDEKNRTALFIAVEESKQQVIDLIISKIKETKTEEQTSNLINQKENTKKQTALHLAAGKNYNDTKTIQALIEAGADINVRDIDNKTPLHIALDTLIRNEDTAEKATLAILETFKNKKGEAVYDKIMMELIEDEPRDVKDLQSLTSKGSLYRKVYLTYLKEFYDKKKSQS